MKVLVTGIGIVSAIGNNVRDTLMSLLDGKSGLSSLTYIDTIHKKLPFGEVSLSNKDMKESLSISSDNIALRTSLMGIVAVGEALVSADIAKGYAIESRCTLINGTTVGGMDKTEQFYIDFVENDTKNEYILAQHCGTSTEIIADYFGFFRQLHTISTACSSAANSILLGAELIKNNRADIVVAGGSEALTKFHINGFNSLMILDDQPCRPFDETRRGLNLGEGAAFVVMESEEHFLKRETTINPLVEFRGGANLCEAYHQTASEADGRGAFATMQKALQRANLKPYEIDYINAHGTATSNNDVSEGKAIEKIWQDKIPFISSTKPFTGHTTSAAGAIEAVISIIAIKNGFIPRNLNFKHQMTELNFTPTTEKITGLNLKNVLSNSYGFGGNNTSLIFSKI